MQHAHTYALDSNDIIIDIAICHDVNIRAGKGEPAPQ